MKKTSKEKIIKYYCDNDAGIVYDSRRYSGPTGIYRQKLIHQNVGMVLSRFAPEKFDRILELAPGSGVLTKFLLQKFSNANLFVVDSSPLMINVLKDNLCAYVTGGRLDVKLGDAESTPFPDSYFDLVCALRLLIHYRDIDVFLREIHRVLKPGGIALVDAHNFMRIDLLNVLYRRFIDSRGFTRKVPSFYLLPNELMRNYSVPGLHIEVMIGHKLLPPIRALLFMFGGDRLLRIEKMLSTGWLKYFCADMYVVLKKDGLEK